MDEEKTIDEAVEDKADEMKEFEPVAFDEVIKDEPAKDTAPVLRALGDPANMNMIHKHLDNFLAMLCGETPIDDNVRDSTEYWLKRLADGLGGSTKKIYYHPITISFTSASQAIQMAGHTSLGRITFIIINNDPTPFTRDSLVAYINALYEEVGTTVRLITGGALYNASDGYQLISFIGCTALDTFQAYCVSSNGVSNALTIDLAGMDTTYFYDGVTAIN